MSFPHFLPHLAFEFLPIAFNTVPIHAVTLLCYARTLRSNAVTRKGFRQYQRSIGSCSSGWESIARIAPHITAYTNIGILQFHFCYDLCSINNAFGAAKFPASFFRLAIAFARCLLGQLPLYPTASFTTLMVRSAAAQTTSYPLARSGCGASRTMRPETGPPSPSRRALAMEYVFDDNLFARPPQAEGETSADFISQIDAQRTGCMDKKKAPLVRRGARYRVRSEQRSEPTASSLDGSVSKFGPTSRGLGQCRRDDKSQTSDTGMLFGSNAAVRPAVAITF